MRCPLSRRPLGVFWSVSQLQDDNLVAPWCEDYLRESLDWFNENLAVPRRGSICWRCVFWFDRSSSEVIGRIWDLVNILRYHDVYIGVHQCRDPGKIVYRDSHQIAAIPSGRLHRILTQ